MAFLLSNLKEQVVEQVVLAVEQARAKLQGAHLIQTEPPEIVFTAEVILDELPFLDGDIQTQSTPEVITEVTRGQEQSTTRQEPVQSSEAQTSEPVTETMSKGYGRTTRTETSEIS